jgi:hypothetical protein
MAKSALGRSFGSLIAPLAGPSQAPAVVGDGRRRGVGLLLKGHDPRLNGPVVGLPQEAPGKVPPAPVNPHHFSELRPEVLSTQAAPKHSLGFSGHARLLLLATDLALVGVSAWLLLFSRDAGSLGSAIAGFILLSTGAGAGILAFRD